MRLSTMKFHYLFLLPLMFATSSWAEFSHTNYTLHPLYVEANEPFVIDVQGDWSTSCHPGEQKPVITEYTGNTVVVEFETIVEHDTCNDEVTPFRVLIDMSDVIGTVEGEFPNIKVTVRYGGDEFEAQVPHTCILLCSPVPLPWDIKPETGLYHSDNLDKQGLLLARQGSRMAAYPLIYDESGSSEWVFAAGGINEDAFFGDLYELTGGQCLGCPPPEDLTEMNVVGKITMVVDREGLVQVKVNDGLFVQYEQSEFGYGSLEIGGTYNMRVPDLSGRWAFIDDSNVPSDVPVDAGYPFPMVFDIKLESVSNIEPPITSGPPLPPGSATFSIRDKDGTEYAQMVCGYDGSTYFNIDDEMVCEIRDPEINNGDLMYEVTAQSLERLWFRWVGPRVTTPPPNSKYEWTAVRID